MWAFSTKRKRYEGDSNIKNKATIWFIKLTSQCLYKIIRIQIVKEVCAPTLSEAFSMVSMQIATIQCPLTGKEGMLHTCNKMFICQRRNPYCFQQHR